MHYPSGRPTVGMVYLVGSSKAHVPGSLASVWCIISGQVSERGIEGVRLLDSSSHDMFSIRQGLSSVWKATMSGSVK